MKTKRLGKHIDTIRLEFAEELLKAGCTLASNLGLYQIRHPKDRDSVEIIAEGRTFRHMLDTVIGQGGVEALKRTGTARLSA